MDFVHVWLRGLLHPVRSFDALKGKPAPQWGLLAVVMRFIPTALLVTLPLALLGREPFAPSSLPFLATKHYYMAQVFFLPLFGIGTWLLMSGLAHVALRLSRKGSDFDLVLNIVGLGMLIPMPVTWAWDISMVALHGYLLPVMAISHSLIQLWEASLEALGFARLLRLRFLPALGLALVVNVLYIALAMIFIR
jgi:hypothetical protein